MRAAPKRWAMASSNVSFYVESRYRVNRKRIVSAINNLLKQQEIAQDVEVSVAVVGDRKMHALNKQYRNLDKTTNVLSFSMSDGGPTVLPPLERTDVLRLGDVIVSYPQVIVEASEEDMLVDDKIDELVTHGVLHLLGIHHEE